MQDDSPWKPPTDAGEPTVPAPDLPVPPVVDADPGLPSLPRLPDPVPVAPVSADPPSPWAPGGAGADVPAPPVPGQMASGAIPAGLGAAADVPPIVPAVASGEGERPRRSKWLVGGAAAAVLAVGATGVFAVSSLTGSTASGAATPEELGLELLTAIENEDVLGAIDVLVPGERASLGEPFVEMISELQRLDVLAETDLSRISGIDVELTGEDVQVRSTNVPDIVNIDLRADAVVSVDGAALPIGDLVTGNLPDDALTELRGTRVTEADELDIWITAVEEDGRWYFSLLHSVAEAGRQDAAPGEGIPLTGVGADGAETPEAAFDGLLDRVEALDLTGMIRALNPGEAAALQRYSPLFLEEAEAALSEVPLEWQITQREFRVEGSGDTRTVFVDALAIEGSIEGVQFSAGFSDGCVRASADGEEFEQCEGEPGVTGESLDLREVLADEPDVLHLIETIEEAFADIEPMGLELRQYDGAWYVSPIGTGSEAFLKLLRALDRQELDDIIAAFEPAFAGFEDMVFDGFEELAGTGTVPPTPFEVIEEPAISAGGVDALEDAEEFVEDGWLGCYDVGDVAEATSCFEGYVNAGDIDRVDIPVALRHPECGYAEVSWSNDIYSLPDADFVAAAEASRGCFLDLVAVGEVSEWELPNEITNLECFEGRNWYTVFDDPDYDERYFDCLAAARGE